MNSNLLIKILCFEYIILATVCGLEGNWPRVLYWFGAIILNIGVLWGMR